MSKIEDIKNELNQFVVENQEQLEQFRLHFLSKKSELQQLLSEIKNIAPELRKDFGQQVNLLKQEAQNIFDSY